MSHAECTKFSSDKEKRSDKNIAKYKPKSYVYRSQGPTHCPNIDQDDPEDLRCTVAWVPLCTAVLLHTTVAVESR